MSAQKWTPGPWAAVEHRCGGYDIKSGGCDLFVTVKVGEYATEQANASLAAAAPDMADALRVFIEWCDSEKAGPQYSTADRRDSPTGEPEWRAWWENQLRLAALAPELARAALAKAGAA